MATPIENSIQKTTVEIHVCAFPDGQRFQVQTLVDGKFSAVYTPMPKAEAIKLAQLVADGDDTRKFTRHLQAQPPAALHAP